jgi:glycosyltransferase involved in cell wall biosynthesis
MSDTEPVIPLVRRAQALGIGRVHVLAWRDLDDAEAGGSEVHAEQVLQRWAAAGLEVTLRTSAAPGLPGRTRRGGLDVVRRGGRMGVFPRAVAAELAGRHGPCDALVEIWNGVPWGSPVWCRGPRVTWLHHVHGPMWELMLGRTAGRVGEFVERRIAPPLYRRIPVVTLSEASRAELVGHLGFRAERVHVVPPGIAPRFHGPASPAAHPLVVAVGRLAPVKRFDTLVRTLAPLAQRFDDLEVVIVGEGDERARIQATIDELGARRWVRLAGRLTDDELVALYRRAWLVASASLAEGWGMTITEAAACGVPAVVTDVGGHRDAVDAGVTGELAAVEQLGAVVAGVLADPARRHRLATAAQARAARFTWDATAAATLAVLVEEAARLRAPRRPGGTPR